MSCFYPMARWLYRHMQALKINFPGSRQVERDLGLLHPDKHRETVTEEYYVKKIALVLTICILGIILGVAVGVKAKTGRRLVDGSVIRAEYGEDAVELELSTVLETGAEQRFSVTVAPQELTNEEAQILYEEFVLRLPELIKADNASLKSVSEDLLLEEQFAGYPFSVEWSSSRPDILKGSGAVIAVEQAEQILLEALITYGELQWETDVHVCVVPEMLPAEDAEVKAIADLLEASEKENRDMQEWCLPDSYRGRALVWTQVTENNSPIFMAGAIVVAVLVFFLSDKDLHDELAARRKRMGQAYPDVVQKLALYLGAGLTVRAAFQRLAAEGDDGFGVDESARAIAREMQYTCRELQAGVSEGVAYEHMAKRIGTQEYLRLSTLLIQNLKKGNSTLLQRLREEAERASVEKMQNCRKLGEEAATKLLVPMVLFLVVVMVMIMLPAFSSVGT